MRLFRSRTSANARAAVPAASRGAGYAAAHAAALAALSWAALFPAACSKSDDAPVAPAGKTAYPWSLDLDLSGDAVLTGVKGDTSATAAAKGEITGKVNGYDSSVAEDTVRFLNVEYELFVNSPLDRDGAYRFDAFDLLGGLDGSMTILIWIKSKSAGHHPVPDTITLWLERP